MAQKIRPLNSVLIKPTGSDCNLDCTYCFYLEKSELFKQSPIHRMSPEIPEELIRQVMQQSGESVSLAWQGGEPTLMGLDFYKRAIDLEKKYGHNQMVGNGLQTNGMLLDKNWAAFLKEYEWLVGISSMARSIFTIVTGLIKGKKESISVLREMSLCFCRKVLRPMPCVA